MSQVALPCFALPLDFSEKVVLKLKVKQIDSDEF
jgi:hypothetical protein